MAFPISPSDGQQYTNNVGTGYIYDSTRTVWLIDSQEIVGNTGIQGVTGIYGLTGLIGDTGIQGYTGINGATGIQGVTGFYGQTGVQGLGGFGIPYYFHNDPSDIVPYEDMLRTPGTGTTDSDDATCSTSLGGFTGIAFGAGYLTSAGDPGVSEIPAGPVTFEIFAKANTVLSGREPKVYAEVLKYDSTGTITSLFTSAWSDILTTSVDRYTITQMITTPVPLSTTDRILTKIYGVQNATNGSTVLTFYYEGVEFASHVQTPLGSGSQGGTGIAGVTGLALGSTGIQGVTGILGIDGATGLALGSTGVAGIQGETGIIGLQGGTGIAGITGLALGETGIQGLTGVLGIDGVTGIAGVDGVTGIAGVGQTGMQGVTGLSGTGSSSSAVSFRYFWI